jgi:hypothetical protein
MQTVKRFTTLLSGQTCKIFTGTFFVVISTSSLITAAKKVPGMIFELNK